jgi:hypothetical protein
MQSNSWDRYYFGVASKNFKNMAKQDLITDVDVHLIKFSLFDEENLPI